MQSISMESNWAAENLQTIRTLMERSAVYRRALAPVMTYVGVVGIIGGVAGQLLGMTNGGGWLVGLLDVGQPRRHLRGFSPGPPAGLEERRTVLVSADAQDRPGHVSAIVGWVCAWDTDCVPIVICCIIAIAEPVLRGSLCRSGACSTDWR